MEDNPVQFAVVREDPKIEAKLVCLHQVNEVLLIASCCCTAFTLQALFPSLNLTLLDFNPLYLNSNNSTKHCQICCWRKDQLDEFAEPVLPRNDRRK